MARRNSVKAPALKSWQEVDEALREIGEAEIKLEEIDGEVTRLCNEIKDKFAILAQSANARIKERTGQIEDFVEAHRDEFGDKKTRLLNFGETGWRQSTSILLPKGKAEYDEIIRRLRARSMEACVIVTEKIDKDALRAYGEDVVRAVGARYQVTDKFWLEANREKLSDV
jgi:phage host-nuclease inhibitor protein Gam